MGKQPKDPGKSGKQKKKKEKRGEFSELPNVSVEFRQEEITEDIYGMNGKMPSRTLKRRAKNVQKQFEVASKRWLSIDKVFENSWKGVCCDSRKYR